MKAALRLEDRCAKQSSSLFQNTSVFTRGKKCCLVFFNILKNVVIDKIIIKIWKQNLNIKCNKKVVPQSYISHLKIFIYVSLIKISL